MTNVTQKSGSGILASCQIGGESMANAISVLCGRLTMNEGNSREFCGGKPVRKYTGDKEFYVDSGLILNSIIKSTEKTREPYSMELTR